MRNTILVINSGSSSIKFAVFTKQQNKASLCMMYRGQITGIGRQAHFTVYNHSGQTLQQAERFLNDVQKIQSHQDAFAALLEWIDLHLEETLLTAIGHRIVHGGAAYSTPLIVTNKVLCNLEQLVPLAPLHQPYQVEAIKILMQQQPGLPQVACFDTAFHRAQPAVAQCFALPRALQQQGIMKYGFHGLSYEYITQVLPNYIPDKAGGRIIIAHLGHGASMCAINARKSVATSMTFSPLDGLPMSTRCGALDPAVVLYLIQEKNMTVDAVADLLHHKSGLLGVSGISSDMRELLDSGSTQAAEAIDLFVYCAGRELGSLAAVLGGLDALIFTAGIGEHSAIIRERICQQAAWLGLRLDKAANAANGPRISTKESPISAWMIPTNEEHIIAEHTVRTVGGNPNCR